MMAKLSKLSWNVDMLSLCCSTSPCKKMRMLNVVLYIMDTFLFRTRTFFQFVSIVDGKYIILLIFLSRTSSFCVLRDSLLTSIVIYVSICNPRATYMSFYLRFGYDAAVKRISNGFPVLNLTWILNSMKTKYQYWTFFKRL